MLRLLLFEVIVLVLGVAIWLGAPFIGIRSVAVRVLIIVALLLPPLVYVLVKFILDRRKAKGLESAIKEQGLAQQKGTRPDRAGEIRVLSDAFDQAVSALKRSKIGGSSGANALYALPWYMIIGPPAAGKSTALLRSGLNFPFNSSSGKGIKGVGGTRNCDWWFSDEAILLDTAGRYTSEDEDLDEWIGFLRLLKKYRRKRPLNGLIVCISIADLLTASSEDLEETAQRIRGRVDQVVSELETIVPVYVLFSKCDLLQGFVEFFGDLKKSSRQQILGFTVPLTDSKTDHEELFNKEFDLLAKQLRTRGLSRLSTAKPDQRPEVYQFPLQFESTKDALSEFLKQLFVHNPYQESPRLRGAYFCSGTQEGRPLDRVMALMGQAFGLKEGVASRLDQKSAKKSYFLHDVFTRVLFPDQALAGTTTAGRSRQVRIRIATFVAGLLVALGVASIGLTSFSSNRRITKGTVELAQGSRQVVHEDPKKVEFSLRALDKLGEQVDELQKQRKDGHPWSQGVGFYSGAALLAPAEKVYIQQMKRAFVDPVGSELEASLVDLAGAANPEAETTRDFDLLKTYLMMTEPTRLDPAFVTPVLLAQWKKRLHPEVAAKVELLTRNAGRYLAMLKAGQAGWLERDEEVVRKVRNILKSRDVEYKRIVEGIEGTLAPFTLRDALQGRVQTTIRASYEVPGLFTRTAWTKFIRRRIDRQAGKGATLEPWVLGEDEGADPASRLRERYFEAYIQEWRKFLGGLSLEPASTAQDSLRLLEALTGSPPLYETLFQGIAFNTELPEEEISGKTLDEMKKDASKGKTGRYLKTAERYGLDKEAQKALERKLNRVEREFLPLKELVSPTPGADGKPVVSGVRQYLAQLELVRDALSKLLQSKENPDQAGLSRAVEDGLRVTKGVLAPLPMNLRTNLRPLFYPPLEATTGKAGDYASEATGKSFTSDLCEPFNEKLAGRYPFAVAPKEALLQDVVDYFATNGTVWTYYNEKLKADLPRRGEKFAPSSDKKFPGNVVTFINQSWLYSKAFFPRGSDTPSIRFDVRPHPAILAEGAGVMVSEITFEVDGKSATYRNGPIEQWPFDWPGPGEKRARVAIKGSGGLNEQILTTGDWALLRLIDRGKVTRGDPWYAVEWSLRQGKIKVRLEFRPSRSLNPLFHRQKLVCN
jgi:type VI secretion system protein ImpL